MAYALNSALLFCIFPSASFLIEFALNMLEAGFWTYVIFAWDV